jgi:hypothetical protein
VPVLIFLLALALRIAIAAATHVYAAPAYGEALSVARHISRDGAFADPFNTPTGPTAHVAPVYPYFWALFVKLFPAEATLRWLMILIGAVGAALGWALLPDVLQLSLAPAGKVEGS